MHTCTMFRLFQPGHGIVIGERQYLDSGRRRARHEVSWGQ
jgi:hypothetical protein